MNFVQFISSRIWYNSSSSFSTLINKIAIGGIALGVTIILLSFLILIGFKNEIEKNVYSFSGHYNLSKYSGGLSYKDNPINLYEGLNPVLNKLTYVKHSHPYILSPVLLKSHSEDIEGVLFKGINQNFNFNSFKDKLIEGSWIEFNKNENYSNQIVISSKLKRTLDAKVGDNVFLYFANNPPIYRKLELKGVFETGMEEFDNNFIFGDLLLLQKIYNWNDSLVSGVEIFIDNSDKVDIYYSDLEANSFFDEYLEKTDAKYIQVFEWLKLLDRNILIFFSLILFVASFNMISILLILIMERIRMIGVLKALGLKNNQIKNIFLFNGFKLILLGIFFGNIISISLGFLQKKYKMFQLDKSSYYMEYVPISWDFISFFQLNLTIFLITFMSMFLPVIIINKIKILDSIKFS